MLYYIKIKIIYFLFWNLDGSFEYMAPTCFGIWTYRFCEIGLFCLFEIWQIDIGCSTVSSVHFGEKFFCFFRMSLAALLGWFEHIRACLLRNSFRLAWFVANIWLVYLVLTLVFKHLCGMQFASLLTYFNLLVEDLAKVEGWANALLHLHFWIEVAFYSHWWSRQFGDL